MQAITAELGKKFKTVELFYVADWHIGSACFNEKAAKELISHVAAEDNRFVCLGGDMMDNATVGSVSDGFKATMTPEDQLEWLVEMLTPIKDRILAVVEGNHEKRTAKTTSINLMKQFCNTMGIADKYAGDAFLLFLKFGYGRISPNSGRLAPYLYVIYGKHGSGGGGTVGGKLNKVGKMAETVDCDVYLHAHTHMPGAFKTDFIRVDRPNSTFIQKTQLFVNTASLLDFGGYGERLGFKPSCKDVPKIIFEAGRDRVVRALV